MAFTQTFPGVYTSVTDNSFVPAFTSRFKCGLVGVAQRGPFNSPVSTRSFGDYISNFGGKIADANGNILSYLPQAAGILTPLTDGLTIVRVGKLYDSVAADGSGYRFVSGGVTQNGTIQTSSSNLFQVNDYVRISEVGKASTVNAQVTAIRGTSLVLNKAASDDYDQANIDRSTANAAANKAEGFLSSFIYGTSISLAGYGNKSDYTLYLKSAPSSLSALQAIINVGQLVKITEAGKTSSLELLVKSVVPSTTVGGSTVDGYITFETSAVASLGYNPIALQDTYANAAITPVATSGLGYQTQDVIYAQANTEGEWANTSVDGTAGLVVTVGPGSAIGTKAITVLYNSSAVEIIDGLVNDSTSPNYYETRINGKSAYIQVKVLGSDEPANTLAGWKAGAKKTNSVTFKGGFNGAEGLVAADYIGTLDPDTDTATGLRIFEDKENVNVNVICVPGLANAGDPTNGSNAVEVAQQAAAISAQVRSAYLMDVPPISIRQGIDWHNGQGLYTGIGKLDTPYAAVFWDWWQAADPFDGASIMLPPTIAALRALAYTFDHYKPWFAAAGETRGLVPEALGVQFPRISDTNKQAMQGNGNCINPILSSRGVIMVYGDRTLQRSESKLSSLHNVILVNYVLDGLSAIGRGYVFDPNDTTLLGQLQSASNAFLVSVANDRGLEGFNVDLSANNATTRNQRNVIMKLELIPTDTMERLFIEAVVDASGATLTSVS